MKCIDTHIHVWNFDRARYSWLDGNTTLLGRSYLIDELEPQLKDAKVSEGVLVQAANTIEETRYMLEVAGQTSWLKGVVGWLPLMDPDQVEDILFSGYARHSLFKGVRHLIHDEQDTAWLLQPPVLESLSLLVAGGIPYDVVGTLSQHLETVLKVADAVPNLHIVLDHLNQPPSVGSPDLKTWQGLMKELATRPNVHAKISGLGTAVSKGNTWGENDIKPAIAFVLEHFGTERCFCGGDWPVSLLAGSYPYTWKQYHQTLTSLLPADEVEKVLCGNASRLYQL